MKNQLLLLFLCFTLISGGHSYANESHDDVDGGIGFLINGGGSFYWPITDTEMKLIVDGVNITPGIYSSDGKLIKIEDQYAYGFNAAIYTPLLFDGIFAFGGSFNWLATEPKDEFKTFYAFGNINNPVSSPSLATTKDDRIAKIDYKGFDAFTANAETLFMLSGFGGSDFNIYIPFSIGMTWINNSDFYHSKSSKEKNVFDGRKSMNFSGGMGFLYSIGENSGIQIDIRYYRIMKLRIPYNKHTVILENEIKTFTDYKGRKNAAEAFDRAANEKATADAIAVAAGSTPASITPSTTADGIESSAISMIETSTAKESYLSISPSYIVFNVKFGVSF